MTFVPDTPTLRTLISQAVADVDAKLGAETALSPDAPEYVLAAVASTQAFGVYATVRQLARNIIPGRDNDPDALQRHAVNWLGTGGGKKDATPARLTIVDDGSSVAGTPIPAGTRFTAADGALYETTIELVVGTDDIIVQSIAAEGEAGFGASGNRIPGSTLTRVSDVDDIASDWLVDGDPADGYVGGGADEETHDELADRVEIGAQTPPQAGTASDIEDWTREVAGVGNAWAYSWLRGPGTVTVYFIRDDSDNPIPDSTLVDNVQAYLDEKIGLSSDGVIFAVAPVAQTLTPTIAIKPNTTEIQERCTLAMREAVAINRRVGDGSWYFDLSWLGQALSAVVGEDGHTITLPATDITPDTGYLLVLGTPVYTTKA